MMTQNQKAVAAQLRKNGFSRRDSKIYAQQSSEFAFQTGVAYVSGVMTAATIGAARMVGKGIGWSAGKAVDGVKYGIAKHRMKKAMVVEDGAPTAPTGLAAKIQAVKEKKAQKKAEAIVNEIVGEAPTSAETTEQTPAAESTK